MKRVILCILACILLMVWMGAAAEKCSHENANLHVSEAVAPSPAGHMLLEEKIGICPDCREKISEQRFSGFAGHVFWMAESLHLSEEGMHLCVFICEECLYVTYREYECDGEQQCLIYSAQEGEIPPVQYLDSMMAWKEANPEEEIIRRWLARDDEE